MRVTANKLNGQCNLHVSLSMYYLIFSKFNDEDDIIEALG